MVLTGSDPFLCFFIRCLVLFFSLFICKRTMIGSGSVRFLSGWSFGWLQLKARPLLEGPPPGCLCVQFFRRTSLRTETL